MVASAAEAFRPLRRVEYDHLVALGVFANERVELLDGALVAMSPIGAPHNAAVQKLTRLLILVLEGRAAVRCQMSFAALELSVPEPDFTIVPVGEYETDHPDQAYLVIEVSESSLAYDRGRKAVLYASCAVPEYWVVNTLERCIEVYTAPQGRTYAQVQKYEPGQAIRLVAFDGVSIAVSDVFK